jgi:hypothetical protein
MTARPDTPRGVGDLVTGAEQVGVFEYLVADSKWRLSPATYAMHGLPLDSPPSTELLMSMKPPGDMTAAQDLLAKIIDAGEPFCFPHRIVDLTGKARSIVMVGDVSFGADGVAERIRGFAVDLTESQAAYARSKGTEAVAAAMEHRRDIEQAKGALVLAYGISPQAAVALLRWHSQRHNVKLNLLAVDLMEQIQAVPLGSTAVRRTLDRVLYDLSTRRWVAVGKFSAWQPRSTVQLEPSSSPLLGYAVLATDGVLGEVESASLATSHRALVVDTGAWVVGQRTMLPIGCVQRIAHGPRQILVDRSLAEIGAAPPFDPVLSDDPGYRAELAAYYAELYRP